MGTVYRLLFLLHNVFKSFPWNLMTFYWGGGKILFHNFSCFYSKDISNSTTNFKYLLDTNRIINTIYTLWKAYNLTLECQSQRKKLEIINSKTFCLWYLLFINVGSIVLKGERTISYCSTYRIVFVRRKNERKKKKY